MRFPYDSLDQLPETRALSAVLDGDENDALEIMRDLLPGELVILQDAADTLSDLAYQVREENRRGDRRD